MKLSGTRFYVLSGAGARLQRALIAWMLDVKTREQGYLEIIPPLMVSTETATSTGHLPKNADTMYHDAEDDFWFIPTAEVPLTSLHRDETLDESSLPIYMTAYTPCFRREKMSAGRDVRGIKRGHQFDKVEMVKLVRPETSDDEFHKMVNDASEICRRLKIPFRVVELCTADLSFASAVTYDLEMWAPGCGEWLEVSSVSNCTDFQARRAKIRFKTQGRQARAGAYAERLGAGAAAHDDRGARELSERRRLRHRSGSFAALYGWGGADRVILTEGASRAAGRIGQGA